MEAVLEEAVVDLEEVVDMAVEVIYLINRPVSPTVNNHAPAPDRFKSLKTVVETNLIFIYLFDLKI